MLQQDPDKVITLVQSSTRNIMNSFRGKTDLLRQCHKDIKLLIREGYDRKIAYEAAITLFGKNRAKFIAIDGTKSQDQELDLLVFYAGAFGYVGQLAFSDDSSKGCTFNEPVEFEDNVSISAAISVHEQDTASIAGQVTEGGIEVDPERIPKGLMRLAEYYMAVKAVYDEDSNIKVVILDGTLAGDVAHLVWSVNEMVDANGCVLQGMETEYGPVTALDLELARMLHPNKTLEIPASRSHLIKYAAINELLGRSNAISYEDLLAAIGADRKRLEKLKSDLTKIDKHYSLFDNNNDNISGCSLKPEVKRYWERVFSASIQTCDYIFNAPEGRHPLIIDKEEDKSSRWISADDLDYLTLVMVYALLRAAWDKNVLVIGISKDVSAREMIKTVVPLLQSAGKIKLARELPSFNSDKMLLQTASVINGADIHAPWRTFEFDTCFRTIAPASPSSSDGTTLPTIEQGQAAVAGAFKNVISAERMFVKSYIQLWGSDTNPAARSHVFSYDRPCYPKYDIPGELKLLHRDGPVTEEIRPIIHLEKGNDNGMSDLVMDILCSMCSEVIPECLGHNYSLFLADKKAKSILEGAKNAYLSTVSFEIANSDFDQQVLFEARFREYRSQIESKRSGRKD